ncbi:MAG: hypothetical protein R2851_01005 [Caldilineaceae bacterium]
MTVGSAGAAVSGSSLKTWAKLPPVTEDWLLICVTPTGSGATMTTSKVTSTCAPAAMVPRSTTIVLLPTVLPVTMAPALVVTEPTTKGAVLPGALVNSTSVAGTLPWFSTCSV